MTPRQERIGGVVFTLLEALTAAWLVMLAQGSLATDFGWPTLSFWQSAIVVVTLGFVVQYGTASLYWSNRRGKR